MTGKLGKFYIQHDIHGARLMTKSHQLGAACIADGEIDTLIQLLKDDLDACAHEMKRVVKKDRRSLFARSGVDT